MDREPLQKNSALDSQREITHLNRAITIIVLVWSIALATLFYSHVTHFVDHTMEMVYSETLIISIIWLVGMVGLFVARTYIRRPILARELTLLTLQESEAKFRGISDAAQDAIILLDGEGNICYWNRAATDIFGYSADEISGHNLHQLIAPEYYHKAFETGWSRFLETGEGPVLGTTTELTALHKDGSEFPVELSVSAITLREQWRAVGIIRDISDRVDVEHDMAYISNKIVQAHREWVDAFDSIHAPIFIHDKDGLITRANQAYADHAEMKIWELIGKPYWECFPKREGPFTSCQVAVGLQSNRELNEEFVLDNGYTFISRATAITDLDGNYCYSIHIMEDITFERRAKESLEESERRFRKLFQHAPLAYQALDTNGDIVEINHAWCELFGYKHKEVLNQPFTNFLPDSQRELFLQRLADIDDAKGRQHAIELVVCRQDGALRLVSLDGRISHDTHDQIERIHFILTDITERREMVDTLRDSEERFRKIFDGTLDGILVAGAADRKFYMANQKICQMLGYTLEELADMEVMDIHPEESLDYVLEQFERQQKGEIELIENIPVKRKDGSIFYSDISSSAITLKENHYQIGIFRDITERKLAEAAQFQLNEMLETSRNCNEVLVRTTEEPVLIQSICNILAVHGNFSMVWVGLTGSDGAIESVTMATTPNATGNSCYEVDKITELNANWKSEDGPCPATEALNSAAIQVIHMDDNDPTYNHYRELIGNIGCLSLVALPLLHQEASLGVLLVYSNRQNFNQQQINMLNELVYDLAYGIAALRLHKERDQMGQRLENNLLQTVRVISRTLETRDPYTAGHQRRVTELSVAIAREMGLDEQRIEGIQFGATIHDIGKIHVPAEILNRPGSLTDMEFGLIKTHAEVGYDLIREIDFPWPVADIIHQHHERLNGSGYPQGLIGDEIILEAKIVAVADVVEAMSSHRPYRPGLGIALALEEIAKNRGTFYEPEVVDTCLNLFQKKRFSFRE